MAQAKPKDTFKIFYRQEGEKHLVKFIPAITPTTFAPKEIEFTNEQWSALKYHFMTAIDDKNSITKLAYIV